jgi:hypothetical protein
MNKKSVTLSTAERIAKLKTELQSLESVSSTPVIEVDDAPLEKIQMDEMVNVMSLLPYPLNLTTEDYGQGKVKKFTKFGEIKKIMYSELLQIMDVHANFVDAGYFYILNRSVIREHGLQEAYSKILTKDKLDEVFLADSDNCLAIYSSANPKQQELIVQILIEKVRENPNSVNLNVVDKISRLAKVNIIEKAESEKEILASEEN